MSGNSFDADVIVIGSGFGGSVAALRFAQAGHSVIVLERGAWVTRHSFRIGLDFFWDPKRNRFGNNELRPCGRNIVPWLGSAVGGGSHIYAGTLKRRDDFDGFPAAIQTDDIDPYYKRVEEMLCVMPYPDWAPYNTLRTTQLLFRAGKALQESSTDLEAYGPVDLGISFAPEGVEPGTPFVNKHGCKQRYYNPLEQSILGGDIDAKNTLDKNYLFLAQNAGAEIRSMHEVQKIAPLPGGGYRVDSFVHRPLESRWRKFVRAWIPFCQKSEGAAASCSAQRVVVAAGSIGSTELLLRCRDVEKTLSELSPALGHRYTTNGDFISFLLPYRGVFVSWAGLIAAIVALWVSNYWLLGVGVAAYTLGLLISREPFDPDLGTTNSDHMRFRGPDGEPQGAYIESGRYPTPVRLSIAILLNCLGRWRPRRYPSIVKFSRFLSTWIPPFQLFARTWPIPLLKMGGDRAFGTFSLDRKGKVKIDYDIEANRAFYAHLNRLGRQVARATGSFWIPNLAYYLLGVLEIPHNQGGVPMGENPSEGVVDHAGRVFGYPDLMVLDGSIIPVSPRLNPALTIAALSERAMDLIVAQIERDGAVTAEEPATE